MHQKYPLVFVAALTVLAMVLQWWPRGRPGIDRACWRACWIALNVSILSGALWLVAYDPDAVMGSPKMMIQAGSALLFGVSCLLAIVFTVVATSIRPGSHI